MGLIGEPEKIVEAPAPIDIPAPPLRETEPEEQTVEKKRPKREPVPA